MQFEAHVSGLEAASQQFLKLIPRGDPAVVVPSCPDWSVADLVYHLSEVQSFWRTLLENPSLSPDEFSALIRPLDQDLEGVFEAVSHELQHALGSRKPNEACWSWSARGGTVGWVARRQHHEAMIHLADLQLAVVGETSDIDPVTAVDGIDEMIDVMLDDFPKWMAYDARWLVDLVIDETAGHGRDRLLTVGFLSGTSPDTGKSYTDLPAARIAEYGEPDATVRGRASDMDLWLWGRGSLDDLRVDGEVAAAEDLRAAIADGTQ